MSESCTKIPHRNVCMNICMYAEIWFRGRKSVMKEGTVSAPIMIDTNFHHVSSASRLLPDRVAGGSLAG